MMRLDRCNYFATAMWAQPWQGAMSLLLLALFLASRASAPGLARKARPAPSFGVDIKDLQLCSNKKCSVTVMNITQSFTNKNRQTLFRGYLQVERPAERWSEVRVVFHKCLGGISSNTCEYKSTWRLTRDACAEFSSPLMPWNTVAAKFQPPFKCPMKAGRYLLNNATINVDALSRLAGKDANSEVTWIADTELQDERSRPFMCFRIAARFIRMGSKSEASSAGS